MLESVLIEIGVGGLPSCARCVPAPPPALRPASDVTSEIRDLLATADSHRGVLMFSGAEAFAHPALPELIDAAVTAGASRIGVQTAGALLAVGGNAAGSLHVGVRHFEIAFVPGDDAERQAEQAAQLAGVKELAEVAERTDARIAVSARIRVCRHTVAHLPAAVGALAEAGVGCVHLEAASDLGSGPGALASIIAACDTGVVNAVWVDVSGVALPAGHAMHTAGGEPR